MILIDCIISVSYNASMKSIGSIIKELREERGVSRAWLSRKANVSYDYLFKVEREVIKKVSHEQLSKIVNALGLSMAQFEEIQKKYCSEQNQINHHNISNVTLLNKPLTTIPVYGKVPAGMPREAWHDYIWEYISVPDVSDKAFGLVVSGDSMVGEDITEGDIVVIEPNMEAHNGDIVVAVIDGSEFTLKKFYRDKDHIILAPANEHYQPIIFSLESFDNRVMILGVMVGVYKRYKKRKIF